jgi:hypothetical protein
MDDLELVSQTTTIRADRNELPEWRPLPRFPGYEASSDGRIRSWRANTGVALPHILKQKPRGEYLAVNLSVDGVIRTEAVHVLVCTAFKGERPVGADAAHDDGNSANNAEANLFWKTRQENILDKNRHGTMARGAWHWTHTRPDRLARGLRSGKYTKPESTLRGETHGRALITEAVARGILFRLARGDSDIAIAEELRCSFATVQRIKHRRNWRHVTVTAAEIETWLSENPVRNPPETEVPNA